MLTVGRISYINCYPVYGAIDRGIAPARRPNHQRHPHRPESPKWPKAPST